MNLGPYIPKLLDNIDHWLKECGQGPTCATAAVPGNSVPWDYCDECSVGRCGLAFVQLLYSGTYSTFPLLEQESNCRLPMLHVLSVGVTRCAPTMQDDGEPPPPTELTDSMLGLLTDQAALRHAITETFPLTSFTQWETGGPQGGCIVGMWQVSVG